MQRFLSSIFALAFAASLGTSALAADSMAKGSAVAKTSMKCTKGQTWVKSYAKKDGTKVKGYCHAAKSAKTTK